jgi:hypothetical protein
MTAMPIVAAAMANQVRRATGSFNQTRASTAAKSGATLPATSVRPVVVRVSASMKQVNIVAHNAPDRSPSQPVAATARQAAGPIENE